MARDQKTLKLIEELKNNNSYVYIPDLVARFVEIDDLYHSTPWNLKQILANIEMVPTRFIPMDKDPSQIQQIQTNLHSDPRKPTLTFEPEDIYGY